MRCLGLLGCENHDATAVYSRRIADEFRHRFGSSCSPSLLALNLYTPEIFDSLLKSDDKLTFSYLKQGAEALIALGAEVLVVCGSRLHALANRLELNIPTLPISDPMGTALRTLKVRRIGLLGAGSAAEEQDWRKRLARDQVLDVFVPMLRDREHLNHVIRDELSHGILNPSTRTDVTRIVYSLRQAGARAVVVVAPDLNLLVSQLNPVLPVIDAFELHALSALDWSLQEPTLATISNPNSGPKENKAPEIKNPH